MVPNMDISTGHVVLVCIVYWLACERMFSVFFFLA